MNNNFSEYVKGVGALAETISLFYSSLLETGFDEEQALTLSQSYLGALLYLAHGGGNNE